VPDKQASAQASGVWHDQKRIVKHIDAPLPDRCLKCNSPHNTSRKLSTLKYYPAYNIALALFGFTYYKKVGVEIVVCATHRAKQKQKALWGALMLVASIGLFLLSVALDTPIMLIVVALVLFFISCIYLVTLGGPLSVTKIKEPYIWLKGADEEYLNTLPQWDGRNPVY
jgi:hypothetical protein